MDITPQEIEVWYVLPGLRREIAVYLKEQNMKQKEIASLLNITESAVSQYLKSKRAQTVNFGNSMKKEIQQAASNIKEKPESLPLEMQKLLSLVRNSNLLCETHRQLSDVPENCDICIKYR